VFTEWGGGSYSANALVAREYHQGANCKLFAHTRGSHAGAANPSQSVWLFARVTILLQYLNHVLFYFSSDAKPNFAGRRHVSRHWSGRHCACRGR